MGSGDAGSVEVDPDALRNFSGTVDSEVEYNFRPAADRLFVTYGYGAMFGQDVQSVNVQAARRKHVAALQSTGTSMAQYINAAAILANAVRIAAERYAATDSGAAARLDLTAGFQQAMSEAQQAAQLPPPPPGRAI